MDFNFTLDTEAAENAVTTVGGAVDSGFYKVTVDGTSITKSKAGNNMLSITFRSEDNEMIRVGTCMDKKWKSGADNFDYSKFMQFALRAGIKTGETAVIDDKTSFVECEGANVWIVVKKEFDEYNDEEKIKNTLYATYEVGDVKAEKAGSKIKDRYSKKWQQAFGVNALDRPVKEDSEEDDIF